MTAPIPTWVSDDSEIPDPFGYGERAVRFLRALKHPKSTAKGRAFELPRFWERITRRIYGDVDEHGRRRVRHAVILLPRGARKTSMAAAWGLLHTFGPEKVPLGEVIVAASDQKQGGIAFGEALGIVQATPALDRVCKPRPSEKTLSFPLKGAKFEALSSDAGTQHGRTPNFAIVDEIHAHKKRDLWDVIRTGLVKVRGSLQVTITTAGIGEDNVAFEVIDYARKVARGEIDDPGTLPILFESPADIDWQDEANWYRVNPGLAEGFPDIAGLRQLAREADSKPSEREAFKQLHLNVWLDSSAAPFVEMGTYDAGAAPLSDDDMAGPCWLAADLSSSIDLSVIIAAWRKADGYVVRPWFFCPRDNLRERQEASGSPYICWAEQGLIEATPGNVIDHRRVEAVIRQICADYDVQEIAFDPALAGQVMSNLMDDGYPAVEMRQGSLTMMPAIAELERAIIARRLQHGGHPVLRMNFANVEVETNSHGHKTRLKKARRWSSIDGAVASAMAVMRASVGGTRSVYESRGILTI